MRDFTDTVNTAACFSIKKARLLAAFVCITLLLAGCDEAPDKEQIERNLAAMQEAVENKEFSAIKKYLHEGFRANDRLGAAEVKRLLQMYSLRHQNINVTVLATETEMNSTYPNRAQTTASVVADWFFRSAAVGRKRPDCKNRMEKTVWRLAGNQGAVVTTPVGGELLF
ncbi:MAG: hypothetical protein U5K56_20670 [Halioglobus sp.]|nr:hypothetical protein [Halioglobus sp.]